MSVIRTNKPTSIINSDDPIHITISVSTDGLGAGISDVVEIGRYKYVILTFLDINVTDNNWTLDLQCCSTPDGVFANPKDINASFQTNPGGERLTTFPTFNFRTGDIEANAPMRIVSNRMKTDQTGDPGDPAWNLYSPDELSFRGCGWLRLKLTGATIDQTTQIVVSLSA